MLDGPGAASHNGAYVTSRAFGDQLNAFFANPDDRRQHQDHVEDLVDRALVEEHHVEARLGKLARDVGLQVGETDHQVGLELEDLVGLRRKERRHPRLLAPRARRPHGVAGDADDAALLAEEIQRLGGLFSEADDALGITRRHKASQDIIAAWARFPASRFSSSRPSARVRSPACCSPTWAPTCWWSTGPRPVTSASSASAGTT